MLLVVLGAGWYWLGWSADDNVPNRNGAGEWRSAPRLLRRILRRSPGPPLISGIALEAVGIVWGLLGLLGLAGVRSHLGPSVMIGSALLLGITWLLVELRGRLRD